jgi:hypothetical protein
VSLWTSSRRSKRLVKVDVEASVMVTIVILSEQNDENQMVNPFSESAVI